MATKKMIYLFFFFLVVLHTANQVSQLTICLHGNIYGTFEFKMHGFFVSGIIYKIEKRKFQLKYTVTIIFLDTLQSDFMEKALTFLLIFKWLRKSSYSSSDIPDLLLPSLISDIFVFVFGISLAWNALPSHLHMKDLSPFNSLFKLTSSGRLSWPPYLK